MRFKGKDITGCAPYRLARLGIGYVPEDRRIFAELTVWENLDVAARSANRAGPLDGGDRVRSSSRSSASCATAWAACCPAASSRC